MTLYKDIIKYAKEQSKRLRADDPRFYRSVTLALNDGSYFHWENAFIEEKDGYNIVYTEHYGFEAFTKSDCLYKMEHNRYYGGV